MVAITLHLRHPRMYVQLKMAMVAESLELMELMESQELQELTELL